MSLLPAKPQRRKPDFTLTMVNIVFLLLLFFISTGSLTNREEAQTEAPRTATLPLEKLPRPLLLLEADGSLFLDGRGVARASIVEAARQALSAFGDAAALNLMAPRTLPVPGLLSVAGELRGAGIAVNLVTLRDSAPAGAP